MPSRPRLNSGHTGGTLAGGALFPKFRRAPLGQGMARVPSATRAQEVGEEVAIAMGRLDGRVGVVTGASRGLGKAIAVALAAEGAAVAVAARTEHQWDERLPGTIGETVEQIEAAGGSAVAIRVDLSDRDDRARLVGAARAALGPITILMNNAAFTAPGRPPRTGADGQEASRRPAAPAGGERASPAKGAWPTFLTTPLPAYERHFLIGPFAAYELTQRVVPDMVAAGYGSIINITSAASRVPGEGPYPDRSGGVLAGYGGAKAALEHFTQCAAYELADQNIAVNALAPSKAILTPGLAYYSKGLDDLAPEEEFAEAAVRLAMVDPTVVSGKIVGHLDVLDGSFRPYVFSG
jgi:7-alpha-hydroxysteroid dehydrogenase